jgi:hypothetical protein
MIGLLGRLGLPTNNIKLELILLLWDRKADRTLMLNYASIQIQCVCMYLAARVGKHY